MYNENFGQFLQSFAGCVRSICELYKKDPIEYNHNKFGIVLVCDGIDKLDNEFMDLMIRFNLFDPEVCYNTVLKTDVNNNQVKRKFEKANTSLGDPGEDGFSAKRYSYATQNIAHVFSKRLSNVELKELLDV